MNKTISKSLAQSIHEKAEERGIKLPESEMEWINTRKSCDAFVLQRTDDDFYEGSGYPAYDCTELGEILPESIYEKDNAILVPLDIQKNSYGWAVMYKGVYGIGGGHMVMPMGEMLLYLLQNGLLNNK